VLAVGITAAILLVILVLGTRRGAELSAKTVLADETHSSVAFALVLALPAIAFVFLIAKIPLPGLKVALGLGMVLMLAGAAMAWSGFHYLFTPAGIEIRTLGFRLRSVPTYEIERYEVGSWNLLGGYGIRGIGEKRAYVWGNRGVRIKTSEGEVFLGHDEPEKIVRDLDLITQNDHQGHEVSRRF
jgi:energy-coupling factor transporter transmembrane protein EcfT